MRSRMRRFSPRKQGENLIRPGRFFRLAAPQADGRIGLLLSSSFVLLAASPSCTNRGQGTS
jgi:hypothetical protein